MNARLALALVLLAACDKPSTDSGDTDTQVADTDTTGDTGLSADELAQGQALYEANCALCHESDGSGGVGSRLDGATIARSRVINVIKNGDGGMPPFEGVLTTEEIDLLATWLQQTFLN